MKKQIKKLNKQRNETILETITSIDTGSFTFLSKFDVSEIMHYDLEHITYTNKEHIDLFSDLISDMWEVLENRVFDNSKNRELVLRKMMALRDSMILNLLNVKIFYNFLFENCKLSYEELLSLLGAYHEKNRVVINYIFDVKGNLISKIKHITLNK